MGGEVGQGGPDGQGPAGNFREGEAVALGVPGDFEHPGGEVVPVDGGLGEVGQTLQKFRHPLQAQGGPKEAGEDLAQAHQAGDVPGGNFPGLQVAVQQGFLPQGHGLGPGLVLGGKVDAPLVQLLFQLLH